MQWWQIGKDWFAGLTLALLMLPGTVGAETTGGHDIARSVVRTVTLANGEWPPYQSRHLKYAGIASRIVQAAFAEQGIKVKYVFLPWKRAYYMARKGMLDGTFVWRESFERVQDFWFSDPIFTGRTVFFHLKEKPFDWRRLNDLKGMTVGETLGYEYVPLDRARRQGLIRVERAPTDRQNLEKLIRGRIDLFPSDLDVGLQLIQTHLSPEQAARLTWSKKPLEIVGYHLMMTRQSPRSPALLKKFNLGLAHLRKKGLIRKWFAQSRHGRYRRPRSAD